jgi:hypothetical protein
MQTVKVNMFHKDKLFIKSKIFPAYLALFHVSFIILMAIFGRYHFISGKEEVPGLYSSKRLS